MAVPTLDRLEPDEGHPGGHTLVRVYGAGFQLPVPLPAVGGVVPPPLPSVGVRFGGVEALRVDVLDFGTLSVLTPPTAVKVLPGEKRDNAGNLVALGGVLVDVEVANLGRYGEQLGGAALLVDGFRYRRPELMEKHALDAVTRALYTALRREVFPEVVYTLDTDWTDDPRLLADLPPLAGEAGRKPGEGLRTAVVLAGPRISESLALRHSRQPVSSQGGRVLAYRTPTVVDVAYTLGAYSSLAADVHALSSALVLFVKRHPRFEVPVAQGASEVERYDFGFDAGATLAVDVAPAQSNSKSVAWGVVVSGVELVGSPLLGDMAEAEVYGVEDLDLLAGGA